MAQRDILKDTASFIGKVFLRDSTTGLGKTGVAAASMSGDYCKDDNSADVALSFATGAVGDAYSSGKWAEIGNGYYLYHFPNACWTAFGETGFSFRASGAIDAAPKFRVVALDSEDAVRLGITALPNAAAGAAGGLPTDSTGKTSFNDIAATAVVSGGAITTSGGAVSTVTTVGTCTTNTDMRGTDSAYTGTPPTVAAIADAVWDEATSGHVTAGTYGVALSDILVDTGTTLQSLITDVPADTLTNLFVDANWTDLVSDVSAVLVDTGTTIPGTIATVDANVDAILVDTGTTIPATIATVDTNVDTLITQLTTAVAEPAGAPAATATVAEMLAYMFSPLRNKVTVSSSTMTFYNDAGTAVWSKALSDDATTYTETEGV